MVVVVSIVTTVGAAVAVAVEHTLLIVLLAYLLVKALPIRWVGLLLTRGSRIIQGRLSVMQEQVVMVVTMAMVEVADRRLPAHL